MSGAHRLAPQPLSWTRGLTPFRVAPSLRRSRVVDDIAVVPIEQADIPHNRPDSPPCKSVIEQFHHHRRNSAVFLGIAEDRGDRLANDKGVPSPFRPSSRGSGGVRVERLREQHVCRAGMNCPLAPEKSSRISTRPGFRDGHFPGNSRWCHRTVHCM